MYLTLSSFLFYLRKGGVGGQGEGEREVVDFNLGFQELEFKVCHIWTTLGYISFFQSLRTLFIDSLIFPLRDIHVLDCVTQSSSPSLPQRVMFQDPQWIPETTEST